MESAPVTEGNNSPSSELHVGADSFRSLQAYAVKLYNLMTVGMFSMVEGGSLKAWLSGSTGSAHAHSCSC